MKKNCPSLFCIRQKYSIACQARYLAIEHGGIIHSDHSLLLVQYKSRHQDNRLIQLYMLCLSKKMMIELEKSKHGVELTCSIRC